MDVDENSPLRRDDPLTLLVRQDLDPLSVAELEERITILRGEIERTETKLRKAGDHRSIADALFRK